YRGPEATIDLPRNQDDRDDAVEEALQSRPDAAELQAAVVLSASPRLVRVQKRSGEAIDISGEGLRFAANALTGTSQEKNRIRRGAIIRIVQDAKKQWAITQVPEVSAAFVSLDSRDGAVRSFVGGFDFGLNKFDHVTQAWRQPGSTIKPFIYSSALEKGFSPGTMIID